MNIAREKYIVTSFSAHPDINKKLNKLSKKYKTSKSRILEYLIIKNYEELMENKSSHCDKNVNKSDMI